VAKLSEWRHGRPRFLHGGCEMERRFDERPSRHNACTVLPVPANDSNARLGCECDIEVSFLSLFFMEQEGFTTLLEFY
jgi:hypothetical protein